MEHVDLRSHAQFGPYFEIQCYKFNVHAQLGPYFEIQCYKFNVHAQLRPYFEIQCVVQLHRNISYRSEGWINCSVRER